MVGYNAPTITVTNTVTNTNPILYKKYKDGYKNSEIGF